MVAKYIPKVFHVAAFLKPFKRETIIFKGVLFVGVQWFVHVLMGIWQMKSLICTGMVAQGYILPQQLRVEHEEKTIGIPEP